MSILSDDKKQEEINIDNIDDFLDVEEILLNPEVKTFLEKLKEQEDDSDEENSEYRDIDKELLSALDQFESVLSNKTISTIRKNPEKMKEIIEALRKRNISKEQGRGIAKVKTISRDRGGPSLS